MKRVFILCIFLLISIIRCGDEILNSDELQQGKFINLPENPALGDTTKFDIIYEMTGSYGISVEFIRQFAGGPFGQYCISATLLIEAGTIANTDTLTCLLSVDAGNTSVLVSPVEQYFARPLKLTLTYCGIDLQGYDPTELDFVYSNGNGVILDVPYDFILVNIATGTLQVVNALVQYDPNQTPNSRYGWVRKVE